MNKFKYLAVMLIAVAGLGLQQAQAHLVLNSQFNTPGPIGDPQAEHDFLLDRGLIDECCTEFTKFETPGTNQFFTVTGSGNTWTVTWDFGTTGFTLCGALIKDGKAGGGHLYRFYDVTPDELTGGSGTVTFDNPIRDISHLTFFYGICEQPPGVPDGGTTVMLLGAALGALGITRRYLKI